MNTNQIEKTRIQLVSERIYVKQYYENVKGFIDDKSKDFEEFTQVIYESDGMVGVAHPTADEKMFSERKVVIHKKFIVCVTDMSVNKSESRIISV